MIVILLLQQLDGNAIKPLLLGDRLGLPALWVLASVTLGGKFAGVLGMFLGIPVFALFYKTLKDYSNQKIKENKISIDDM